MARKIGPGTSNEALAKELEKLLDGPLTSRAYDVIAEAAWRPREAEPQG